MEQKKAKAQLEKFLKGRTLTFSTTQYPSGEWIAQCNEIPGILTGGLDLGIKDALIRDAILTAANVDTRYSNTLLKNVGYTVSSSIRTRQSAGVQQLTFC